LVKCLRAVGIIAEVELTLSAEAVEELVKEAVENEEELLIVAGGDELVEQVAAQLGSTQTALGIIPVGAANQHARALGLPLELEAACALLGAGQTQRIEAGQMVDGAQGSLLIVTGKDGPRSAETH